MLGYWRARLMSVMRPWALTVARILYLSLIHIFDFTVMEYAFAFWQWGMDLKEIPTSTATDDQVFDYLMKTSEPGYLDVYKRQITALLVVLTATGLEAQAYQSALKAARGGDVALEELCRHSACLLYTSRCV